MRKGIHKFSVRGLLHSLGCALRGIGRILVLTPHVWVQLAFFSATVVCGVYLQVTALEMVAIVLAGGILIVAETFNTSIECTLDRVSPEYHPLVRDAKDIAAGAVLITSFVALVVNVLIFYPLFFGA